MSNSSSAKSQRPPSELLTACNQAIFINCVPNNFIIKIDIWKDSTNIWSIFYCGKVSLLI